MDIDIISGFGMRYDIISLLKGAKGRDSFLCLALNSCTAHQVGLLGVPGPPPDARRSDPDTSVTATPSTPAAK